MGGSGSVPASSTYLRRILSRHGSACGCTFSMKCRYACWRAGSSVWQVIAVYRRVPSSSNAASSSLTSASHFSNAGRSASGRSASSRKYGSATSQRSKTASGATYWRANSRPAGELGPVLETGAAAMRAPYGRGRAGEERPPRRVRHYRQASGNGKLARPWRALRHSSPPRPACFGGSPRLVPLSRLLCSARLR